MAEIAVYRSAGSACVFAAMLMLGCAGLDGRQQTQKAPATEVNSASGLQQGDPGLQLLKGINVLGTVISSGTLGPLPGVQVQLAEVFESGHRWEAIVTGGHELSGMGGVIACSFNFMTDIVISGGRVVSNGPDEQTRFVYEVELSKEGYQTKRVQFSRQALIRVKDEYVVLDIGVVRLDPLVGTGKTE